MINEDILKNDVCPLNQTDGKFKISEPIGSKFKVLFIGNSITLHEKAERIGWNRNCGMAASSEDTDYVHLVVKGLEKKYGKVSFAISNASEWEWSFWQEESLNKFLPLKNFNADLIIFRIGENVNREELSTRDFYKSFESFVNSLKNEKADVLITDTFWEYDLISEPMKSVADKYGYKFVSISDLGYDDENKAIGLFEHKGVASHPGDLGMQRIAERILLKLSEN